jgi:serine protease Do
MKTLILSLGLIGLQTLSASPTLESLSDLKVLQEKVQNVVVAATPATVSLVSLRNGSAGSGVIVSEDGLILTAAHVVHGNRQMTVIFPDGREERARVLGANYTRDAAMAQLIGEGPWPFVEVGESDPLVTGDFVVAMGHPKGYDPTRRPPVRFGRVMTKDRSDFITTDCTVIGGDSGGPLFDLEGKVVGIHSHINVEKKAINRHGGATGFKKSWDKMLAGRKWGFLGSDGNGMSRPVIGVILGEEAEALVVQAMPSGSPALEVGVRIGDELLRMGGGKISSLDDLRKFLIDYEAGDTLKLVVRRNGEELEFQITLAGLRSY